MTPIVQGFFYLIGLIYMKPDYQILPHHCLQSLPNASKDEGTQFAGGGSWMKEVHNSDFTVLETVGCDGHHISPTPPATGKGVPSCWRGHEGTPR